MSADDWKSEAATPEGAPAALTRWPICTLVKTDTGPRFARDGSVGDPTAGWEAVSHRFGQQDRRTKFLAIEGRYRQRVGEHLTLEGAVLYRTEDDSLSGDDEGVDVDLALEWIIRETEVRVTYEFGRFEDDFAENKNQTLYVQMRRKF